MMNPKVIEEFYDKNFNKIVSVFLSKWCTSNRTYDIKKITKKSFYKILFELILNVILNLTLIPKGGICGVLNNKSIHSIYS